MIGKVLRLSQDLHSIIAVKMLNNMGHHDDVKSIGKSGTKKAAENILIMQVARSREINGGLICVDSNTLEACDPSQRSKRATDSATNIEACFESESNNQLL